MGAIMPAIGKIEQNLYQLLIRVPVRGILIFIAAPKGLVAIGIAFIISGMFETMAEFIQCRNIIGIRIDGLIKALNKSLWITLISCCPAIIIYWTTTKINLNPWITIVISAISCFIFWMASIFMLKHPLHKEIIHSLDMVSSKFS